VRVAHPPSSRAATRLALLRRAIAVRGRLAATRRRAGRCRRATGLVALGALVLGSGAGYVVERGDTLTSIAGALDTSVSTLVRLNGLADPDRIVAGQRLQVPSGAAVSAPAAGGTTAAPAGDRTHRVTRGEALSRIARTYGVTTAALARANRITDPDRIYAGQVLSIPGGGSAAAAGADAPVEARPAPATGMSYTVVAGDTLSRIASRHGVTLRAVVDANAITDPNRIRVGQVLTLPTATAPTPAPAPTPPSSDPPTIDREEARALIREIAVDYGWDPAWVLALAWQESGWQQSVVSSSGAMGIMQVMPGTGEFVSRALVGRTLDLADPRDNVTAGVAFLDYLFDLTGGDIEASLAGYYQGLASVRRNGMYPDTARYIANVVALRSRFE
jgi:N-acetylmuramoyl-L-alanine amidase